jgi:hypothetical protein
MSGMITNEDAGYALDMVKVICTQVGPGLPGSTQERERAYILKRELETHLGAENVAVEPLLNVLKLFLEWVRSGGE